MSVNGSRNLGPKFILALAVLTAASVLPLTLAGIWTVGANSQRLESTGGALMLVAIILAGIGAAWMDWE